MFNRKTVVAAVSTVALFAAGSASAAAVDYSVITSALDMATVATALVAIGGVVAIGLAARKGVRMVLGMIK